MSQWIARELGPDVPLHFTAFHPDFKMTRPAAHAGRDADARARASRMRRGPALRLHRQRARPRGRHDLLPVCGERADRARLASHRGLSR